MRRALLIGSAVLVLAVPASSALARETKALQPSSKWVLDYADERCSLARNFGSGDDSITMQVISYGDWNNFHTLLTGPLVPRPLGTFGNVRVAFPADKQRRDPVYALQGLLGKTSAVAFDLYFGPYTDPDKGLRLLDHEKWQLVLERDRPQPDFDRQVDTITLELNYGLQLKLDIGNIAAPLAALRDCVDDLYKSWGLDPEVQRTLSRLPRPLPQTVYQVQSHFPFSKLRGEPNGYVRARLLIDASGEPKSCVVQVDSVDEAYKKAVCDHLTGRFEPGLDKGGHPVESMYYTSVTYLIG